MGTSNSLIVIKDTMHIGTHLLQKNSFSILTKTKNRYKEWGHVKSQIILYNKIILALKEDKIPRVFFR
jgi:hypothetical protein